jgi:hypothetical protein
MRDFLQIATGVDVLPLLHALALKPELWNQVTTRTFHQQSAHRAIDDILLRYNRFDSSRDDFVEAVCSEIACVTMPAMAMLPQAQNIVTALMARIGCEHLGRVFISRMAPGVSIPWHSDRIDVAEATFPDKIPPAMYYKRYQVPLKNKPGVVFRTEREAVFMEPGSVWWFDNTIPHEVVNNSDDDRIAMVIDIRPFSP